MIGEGGADLAPPSHFIDVAQEVCRVFIDAVGPGAFEFAVE